MADLDNLSAAQTVKIAGADSTGLETNFVNANSRGELESVLPGTVSTVNSTTANLGIGATFTGTFEEITDYSTLSVIIFANQASATDGFKLQFSSDGTNVDFQEVYTIAANVGAHFRFPTNARYFRVQYINGAVAQTVFRLQSILHMISVKSSSERMTTSIIANTQAEVVKSVGFGIVKTDGSYQPIQVDNEGRLVTSSLTGFGADFTFGDVTTAALTRTVVKRTAYIEQVTNAQRSIASASANDTAAGTGARTVKIEYFDQTGAGPFSETVTLNGTTYVNTVATNICFIEQIIVLTAGSTGSNVGILTLKAATAGGGATIGTIAATNNQTFWAHHYVPTGKICNITGISCGHNGTTVGSGALFTLNAQAIGLANAVETQVSDFVRLYGQTSTFARNYTSPIKVIGPARIQMYVTPETASSTIYRSAFDFFEP
jgi:hypothetical protein